MIRVAVVPCCANAVLSFVGIYVVVDLAESNYLYHHIHCNSYRLCQLFFVDGTELLQTVILDRRTLYCHMCLVAMSVHMRIAADCSRSVGLVSTVCRKLL